MPGPVRHFISSSSSRWNRYRREEMMEGEEVTRPSLRLRVRNLCIPLLQQQLETSGKPLLSTQVLGHHQHNSYERDEEPHPEEYHLGNVQSKLKNLAEDKSVQLSFSQNKVELPVSVRSTFLMVFSPDGGKVASTHGDHKIYISEVRTGKMMQTLSGHPRTPWCLAFHPSLKDVVASGCLAGEVRVWDLRSGACEVWVNEHGSVIASLSFHPFDHVILVATWNELHFWDWRQSSTPFMTLATSSDRERVRFVKFDSLGTKIITGISNLNLLRPPSASASSSSSSHPFVFTPIGPRSPFGMFPVAGQFNSSSSSTPPPEGTLSESFSNRPEASPSSSSSGWRMSLLSRVTSMTRQLEGMERNNNPAPDASSLMSDQAASVNNYSQSLISTFRRLHSLCTRLAQLMQEQQTSGRFRDASRDIRSTEATSSLNDLLSRLQQSLQSMSSAALTTAIAQEEIHQVRRRVNEILERLVNVSGYRSRLSSLRDQIYDVAERYATAADSPDIPGSQRWDLIHCLWLVDMSIHLTRQMQRILAADYRLTQIALANSSSSSSSNASLLSSLSQFAASSGVDITSDHELISSLTSRSRPSILFTAPTQLSSNQSNSSSSYTESRHQSSSSVTNSSPRFHPYVPSSSRGRASLSSRSSPRSSFNIPLVRVSGPEDLSPADEPQQPEHIFVQEAFARERVRSPPLPEIQQILQVSLSRAAAVASSSSSSSTSNSLPIIIPTSPPEASPSVSDPRYHIPLPSARGPSRLPFDGPSGRREVYPAHLWFSTGNGWQMTNSEMGWFTGGPQTANVNYRLQCWHFSRYQLPNLKNPDCNVVVSKCRIHNDASVDMNASGTLLAALVPIENSSSVNLCIYSLEKKTFAQCLYLWTFGVNAISVSLSPLSRYIAVGLTTPRATQVYSYPPVDESVTIGQIFQLNDADKSCPSLQHVRNINVSRGDEAFSLNSIRWLPQAGEGFIYGTNRGHLVICRPEASVKVCNNPFSGSGNLVNSRTSMTTGTQTMMSPIRYPRSDSLSSTSSTESSNLTRNRTLSIATQTSLDDSASSSSSSSNLQSF